MTKLKLITREYKNIKKKQILIINLIVNLT